MKRIRTARLLASMILLLVTPPALAEAPATKPARPATTQAAKSGKAFLWNVKNAEGKDVGALVGSIHLATDDFYPLNDAFYDAFDAADTLVVEVDMSKVDQLALQQSIMQSGMYQAPDGLSQHVSKETMDALNAYGKVPAVLSEQMKPWLLATLITMQEIQQMGYDPTLGIDLHFTTKANEAQKPIAELETAQAQFDLLSGFDEPTQEKFLSGTLKDMKDIKPTMEKVALAWKRGDTQTIEKELLDKTLERSPELKPVMEKLFDERNAAMAGKIDAMIKEGKKPFVVIGAGHLVSDKGVAKLLADKGYKVEQATLAPSTQPATTQAEGGSRENRAKGEDHAPVQVETIPSPK